MEDQVKKSASNELLLFFWKKRLVLITSASLAFIAGVVISLVLPVLYESTAIVFPTATSTVSFSEQRNAKANSMDFGEEEHAEQLLQILQSSRIKSRIIEQFDLAKVYDLKPDEKNFYYKLGKAYDEHISFERTRYGSIKIAVLDEEPERAAEIANKIVLLIDTVKNEMIKERTIPAYEVNRRKMEKLNRENENLIRRMDSLSALGVVHSEARANLFSALNESKNPADREYFRNKIEVNLKFGALYDALADLRENRIEKLTIQEMAYEQAESDAHENFNHKFVVEDAVASDKKAKPKRMIIVLLITLATVIFTLISLLIAERIKELKKIA
jgi:LPS O-antigen subunit length determinant protein (WzzB/FepE family)